MESGFLHETKTILKSLVISCPNGMTVERLNRDYRETVGGCIPFKKLGYQSLELFLKSVPDTLVLTGHGREARVGFVSNEKTQHINEMISHQKNTTRDRKAAVRLQPVQNSRSVHSILRPPPAKVYNQPVSTIYCTFNPNPIQIYQPPINLYQPGRNVYQNYSHPSRIFLPEKLNSQPIYYAPTTNVYFKKTEPNYQKTYSKRISKEPDENKKTPTTTNNSEKQNNINNLCNELNKTNISVEQKKPRQIVSEPNNSKSVLVDIQNSNTVIASKDSLKNINDDRKNTNDKTSQEKSCKSADKIIFPSKSKVTEKSLTDHSTTSKSISQPPPASNSKTESEKILKDHQMKPKSAPAQQADSKGATPPQGLKFPNAPMKFSSRKKLTEKIIKRPELPTVSESQALVNPKAKVDTDAVSSVSKASSLNENMKKKFISDPFSQMDSSDNDIDEAVPEFAADYRVFHVDFPENTVPFGKKIPSLQLPRDFTKGAVVGVFISEIHSPFKFWFHPHKENHELDVLMCGIECFYQRLGDADLLIPKSCINPGQVCVALYNDMWHRAEILSPISKNKVKVHFVDYGTVSEVEIQYIKYLQNRFAETPVQAIRGSLSHIKPISQVWNKRAVKEFLSLVSEVLLYAQIAEIDEKEKTVYMVLCDTNSGKTLQINTLLVDRGFAKLDREWDETKIAQNGYRKRHPRDIFPTFEMLETGEYPSLCELDQLLAQGIDYERITEQIILSKFHNTFCDEVSLQRDYSEHIEKMSFSLLDTNPFKSDIISEIVSLKMFDK